VNLSEYFIWFTVSGAFETYRTRRYAAVILTQMPANKFI